MANEDTQQLVRQAVQNYRDEKYEAAIETARQALDQDARSSEAWCVLGAAYSRAERYDEATDALQRAIQTGPYLARNYFNLAMHYYGLGQKGDAVSMCQEAIRCEAKHKGAHELLKKLESDLHVEIAPYQTSLGDTKGSAYQYKKAEGPKPAATNPQDPLANAQEEPEAP